ncbi:MAG: AzlD domain-containing protein [Firmicutes bacterium]|nr:AzlD domain-containing protein [Bacillota bacterium]
MTHPHPPYSSLEWWTIVLGMAAATYLPRALPTLWLARRAAQLPPALRRWLEMLPPAALGALVVPGILYVAPGRPWVGVAGGVAALVIAALTRSNLAAVVLGAALVAGLALQAG